MESWKLTPLREFVCDLGFYHSVRQIADLTNVLPLVHVYSGLPCTSTHMA